MVSLNAMGYENYLLNDLDSRLIQQMASFLPKQIFDAHAHLYDSSFLPSLFNPDSNIFCKEKLICSDYMKYQGTLFGPVEKIHINLISMPDLAMADRQNGLRKASVQFLVNQLEQQPEHVGEVVVLPDDTEDDIESLLIHPSIRGFKCYHTLAKEKPSWNAKIETYLPESAWRVAHERGLCITLHLVRDQALADSSNNAYIKQKAEKYPNATLILAHAARGFAAWTTLISVSELKSYDNVWFDLSAICEPTAIFAILKHCGYKRVLWGSDFPVSMARGKAISLADSFYWIYKQDLERFQSETPVHATLIGIENLLAVEQACCMLDLGPPEIEDIFYNNARLLFCPSSN